MKKTLFFTCLVVSILWAGGLFAVEMVGRSFKITSSSMNSGGNTPTLTNSGTGSYRLGSSIGQSSPIGYSTDLLGVVFGNGAGFWYQLPDSDQDGIPDMWDNCTEVSNPDQRDTDGDGYGNICDFDINNDNQTNFLDLGVLKSVFMSSNADADFNGDGHVNFLDLGLMKSHFMQPPGPSGLVP